MAAAAVPAESVESMRRRARHRLLGAGVLVLLGVVGFPLLFDTQPRPVPVDIPIEIPDRNKAKPLVVPPASQAAPAASSGTGGAMITESADGTEIPAAKPPVVAAAPVAEPKPEAKPKAEVKPKPEAKPEKPEVRAEAKPERKPEPKPEVRAEAKPERKPEAKPEPKPEAKPEPKPEAKPAAAKAQAADDARARALLDGKGTDAANAKPATAAADSGRFVVQVGAYADADKARDARQKLEKAGLKTYTHVAKTADGERIRVRVGPFASRADADKAADRIKGLALPAAVLTL